MVHRPTAGPGLQGRINASVNAASRGNLCYMCFLERVLWVGRCATAAIRSKTLQNRRLVPLMLSCLCFLLLVSPSWGEKGPTLAQLRQAVINNPQDPEANYKLGLKYEELGRPQVALKYLQEAVKLRPDYA